MKNAKDKLLKFFNIMDVSVSAISQNDFMSLPLEDRIQLGEYSFTAVDEIEELNPFRNHFFIPRKYPTDLKLGYFSKELQYWYCDYCGNKNLETSGICASCYELKGAEEN